jgi:flagellin
VDTVDVSTQAGAQSALDDIDSALAALGDSQATLGAQTNRLEGAVNELSVRSENTASARSRLNDVDVASEMMKMKMSSIALEAGIATQGKLLNFSQSALSLITGSN